MKSPNDIAKVVIPRSDMKEGGKVKGKISWNPSEDSDGLEIVILSVQISCQSFQYI